jgi:pyruvate formate lyase activating enzyme
VCSSDLKNAGLNVLPRIPVIPGCNNSLEDALGFARLLREAGLPRAQLLPFHQMGERKYEALKRDYALRGVPQLHREDLEEYKNVFIKNDVDCFF